ncbi:hypothetical protein OESDEN_25524, partial [Oesophagostomum dentatum]
MSSTNCSSPRQNGRNVDSVTDDDSTDGEVFGRQPELDWNRLDNNGWSLFDSLIEHGEEVVIDSLLEHKDYATAFMLAKDSSSLMRHVAQRYIAEQLEASQRLLSLVATESYDQLAETFPRDQWARLLALVLMRTDRARLAHTMRKIATRWIGEGGQDSVHAAFAAVLANDVELLLSANRDYPLEERTKQAVVLQKVTGATFDTEYEKLLYDYCEKLIDAGVSDAAWRLLSTFKTKDERLLALRHDLFLICGGEERTMSKEPAYPRAKHVQEISKALSPTRPQQRTSVYSKSSPPTTASYFSSPQQRPTAPSHPGMPPLPPGPQYPSVSSYSGYAPSTPPAMPGMLPTPGYQPAPQSMYGQPPSIPGYNPVPTPIAPPPIAPAAPMPPTPPSAIPSSYSNYTSYSQTNVPAPPSRATPIQSYAHHIQDRDRPMSAVSTSSIGAGNVDLGGTTPGWNDPPPLPGKTSSTPTPAPVFEVNWKPLEQAPVMLPNGLPGVASGAPMKPPSTAPSLHQQEQREAPQVSLSAEDQAIMDRLYHLIEAVISVNRTP